MNEAEALKWYYKAAEQGVAEAQFILGLDYKRGEGGVKKISLKGQNGIAKRQNKAICMLCTILQYATNMEKVSQKTRKQQ